MNVMAILAHPDDETIGCGGTLARHAAAGDAVSVATFTNGVGARGAGVPEAAVRRSEWIAALRALGLFPDQAPDDHRLRGYMITDRGAGFWGPHVQDDQCLDVVPLIELAREVSAALALFKPEIVYTHWPGDLNQDHRRIVEAVLLATRPVTGSPVRRLLACEIPETTTQAFGLGLPFAPTVCVSLPAEAVQRKLAAMDCYESERRAEPHPRSAEDLRRHMQLRGGLFGIEHAETFALLREVV